MSTMIPIRFATQGLDWSPPLVSIAQTLHSTNRQAIDKPRRFATLLTLHGPSRAAPPASGALATSALSGALHRGSTVYIEIHLYYTISSRQQITVFSHLLHFSNYHLSYVLLIVKVLKSPLQSQANASANSN